MEDSSIYRLFKYFVHRGLVDFIQFGQTTSGLSLMHKRVMAVKVVLPNRNMVAQTALIASSEMHSILVSFHVISSLEYFLTVSAAMAFICRFVQFDRLIARFATGRVCSVMKHLRHPPKSFATSDALKPVHFMAIAVDLNIERVYRFFKDFVSRRLVKLVVFVLVQFEGWLRRSVAVAYWVC